VYKAICKRSREVVVLKCYLMSSICELYQHQIYREVRLHSSCNHENIINLFAAFQVRAAGAGARIVDDKQSMAFPDAAVKLKQQSNICRRAEQWRCCYLCTTPHPLQTQHSALLAYP
jgi:hypothetical protein